MNVSYDFHSLQADPKWFSIVRPRAIPRRTAFCSLVLLAIAFSIYIRVIESIHDQI